MNGLFGGPYLVGRCRSFRICSYKVLISVSHSLFLLSFPPSFPPTEPHLCMYVYIYIYIYAYFTSIYTYIHMTKWSHHIKGEMMSQLAILYYQVKSPVLGTGYILLYLWSREPHETSQIQQAIAVVLGYFLHNMMVRFD